MKILTVDDDAQVRKLIERFLVAKGHEVVTAENGEQGVAVAKGERPDLIIMDLNMPVMDGFGATRALKADPDTKHIPILVLTAEDAMSSYDAIYDAGADGYLAKPIKFPALLARIAEYA
ncbi:MAG: response regulator [Alphaproteobacteria bacterium]|nr:response regulator [Alphaproteobacteria bacterium]MBF0250808.1 response regulator [Alphaproteobacteria bacterium]